MVYVDNSLAFLVVILVIALGALFFYNENNKQTKTRVVRIPSTDNTTNKTEANIFNSPTERKTEVRLPIISPNGKYMLVYPVKNDNKNDVAFVRDSSGGSPGSGMECTHKIRTPKLFTIPYPTFNTNFRLSQVSDGMFSRVVIENNDGIIIGSTRYYPGSNLNILVDNEGCIFIKAGNVVDYNINFE